MLESLNNNKKLLPRQAAEQIIKLIRENQLQAGEKLPGGCENPGIQKYRGDQKRKGDICM